MSHEPHEEPPPPSRASGSHPTQELALPHILHPPATQDPSMRYTPEASAGNRLDLKVRADEGEHKAFEVLQQQRSRHTTVFSFTAVAVTTSQCTGLGWYTQPVGKHTHIHTTG